MNIKVITPYSKCVFSKKLKKFVKFFLNRDNIFINLKYLKNVANPGIIISGTIPIKSNQLSFKYLVLLAEILN